ncbi:glutathionyl-hydroquinone reductase YqjG-like [Haliotis rubra]|uniref:glutathionyl-hydroquinone reductase YqjG-like n=1 Tax=Haliotis rubra TaxID=36100 RepID=UPI001EE50936|nr:glutathionyl-hydroquinone reductase YqjG-like [Haliotis rubra]
MSSGNSNASDNKVIGSWKLPINEKGEYVRKQSAFRKTVTANGSSGFKAESNRYHLYVSLACPWAHRTLILRTLKGLEDAISCTVVDWLLGDGGWKFTDEKPGCSLDTLNGATYLRDIYLKADPEYQGRITVPVLWDKQSKTIVNNESSEIIRMFNTEFNAFCKTPEQRELNFYPAELQAAIDGVNEWVFPQINNGVYRCGFAQSQGAYDNTITEVFQGLDRAEEILSKQRYLTGSQVTEADIRLFTSLVRFDNVYHTHFKCNRRQIINYPNLWGYTRDMYQLPGVSATVDMEHILKHYYEMKTINPFGIVPVCPRPDFTAPHDRAKLSAWDVRWSIKRAQHCIMSQPRNIF